MQRSRKAALAAAAVDVLARYGPRGLTHRAVDTAAGLSAGAVNYHAPSRERLLELALDEVFERDMETAARHFALESWSRAAVIDAVVGFVDDMCEGDNRRRVIARHHLQGEALTHVQLRSTFDVQLGAFVQLVRDGMTAAGVPATTATAELFALSVDGLLRRQIMTGAAPLPHGDVRVIAEIIATQ